MECKFARTDTSPENGFPERYTKIPKRNFRMDNVHSIWNYNQVELVLRSFGNFFFIKSERNSPPDDFAYHLNKTNQLLCVNGQ